MPNILNIVQHYYHTSHWVLKCLSIISLADKTSTDCVELAQAFDFLIYLIISKLATPSNIYPMFIEMELYLGSLHEWVHCMSKIPCRSVVLQIIYNGSLHSITHSFAIRSLLWLQWFLKSPQSLLNVPTQMDNRTTKQNSTSVIKCQMLLTLRVSGF